MNHVVVVGEYFVVIYKLIVGFEEIKVKKANQMIQLGFHVGFGCSHSFILIKLNFFDVCVANNKYTIMEKNDNNSFKVVFFIYF